MFLILMQLLDDDPPATIERRVWTREWIKRREELGAYHTLFRELATENTLGFGEYMRMPHAKFLARGGGCRAPFNKARDPYEDIYCTKRNTCPRYQILGNRRDVSVPFLPVSDWQAEYCVSDCNGSMRRNLPSFGKTTLTQRPTPLKTGAKLQLHSTLSGIFQITLVL